MATEDQRKGSRLSEYTKSNQLEWKRKMLVFSFFLTFAVIIWLLNALNKNYTTEINYPITYSKFPQNKLLVSEVPDHLRLKVSGHGYALLSYKLTNRPIPVNFPVSTYTMNNLEGDTSRFYMLTRYARDRVSRQISSDLQLMEISPDSLIFQFATRTRRVVPVKPVIDFGIGRDFTLKNGISIEPESIAVTGPDIFLDTLQYVHTKKLELGNLEKSYQGVLQVRKNPDFKYSTDRLDCSIELEKFTGVQVMVPVQVAGLPDSLRLQTFPQEVRVSGKIGLSNYERIVPEAFWIEVDYMDIEPGEARLPVHVKTKPGDLSAVAVYPQTVEYLLSEK